MSRPKKCQICGLISLWNDYYSLSGKPLSLDDVTEQYFMEINQIIKEVTECDKYGIVCLCVQCYCQQFGSNPSNIDENDCKGCQIRHSSEFGDPDLCFECCNCNKDCYYDKNTCTNCNISFLCCECVEKKNGQTTCQDCLKIIDSFKLKNSIDKQTK